MLRFVVWNCVEREDELVFSRGWDQLRHCASEHRFSEPPQLNWKDCNENWELLQPHWSTAFRHLFFLCISQMMSGRLRDLDGVGGVLSLLSSTFCWNQVKLQLNILELMESPFSWGNPIFTSETARKIRKRLSWWRCRKSRTWDWSDELSTKWLINHSDL